MFVGAGGRVPRSGQFGWVAEGLADVLVAGKDKSSAGDAVAVGKPTVVRQAAPAAVADFTGGYFSGGGEVRDTTGKVFFTLGGTNYVCSGSAVTSGNKDVVLTAGQDPVFVFDIEVFGMAVKLLVTARCSTGSHKQDSP